LCHLYDIATKGQLERLGYGFSELNFGTAN
jgi:hypothetical protein